MLSKFPFNKKKAGNTAVAVKEKEKEVLENPTETEGQNETEEKSLFNFPSSVKNNQVMMDVILSIQQAAHQQQMYEHQMNELQNQFRHTSGQLEEQISEVQRMTKTIHNKNNHLEELERKITERNLKFDQLMEDYQEMQASLSNEIEDLKNLLNVEKRKNISLNDQYEKEMIEWASRVKRKDEQILELESKNDNLQEHNEQIRKENHYLRSMVNDFTSRMSASFIDHNATKDE